jgi:hypothetical protein
MAADVRRRKSTLMDPPPNDRLANLMEDAAVGAITTSVGSMLGPEGALVAGLVGIAGTHGIRWLIEVSDRIKRETGLDVATIQARSEEDERLAVLFGEVFRATVASDNAAKRGLLAMAAARALNDDADVDAEAAYVRTASQLNTADIRVLAIIGTWDYYAQPLEKVGEVWPGGVSTLDSASASLTSAGLLEDPGDEIQAPAPTPRKRTVRLSAYGRDFLARLRAEGLDDDLAREDPT